MIEWYKEVEGWLDLIYVYWQQICLLIPTKADNTLHLLRRSLLLDICQYPKKENYNETVSRRQENKIDNNNRIKY